MALLVSCPHCLDLFPARQSARTTPIHCAQCGKAFFVTDEVHAETSTWYVLRGGKQYGPYPLARLRELAEHDRVLPTDLLARIGARPWVQAGSLQALFPQEELTPPRHGEHPGDSDEMMVFDPATAIQGPPSQDGIRFLPQHRLTLGDFQVLRKLGAGGMGAVYLAWQRSLERHVALKVLSKSLAKEKGYVDRFYREADMLAGLAHPNIIGFYGVGQEREFPYFAMEYVEGVSTARAMRHLGGPLPVADALHVALQCARALRYAHANRVVHRDIKPENVMITRRGHVKITDLGLAKAIGEDSAITDSGMTLGTPKYMAPEQARDAKRADHRSDLFALGAVLYHLLTGKPPFVAETAIELQVAKEQGRYPDMRSVNPAVPASVEPIIQKLLVCECRQRYQSADELIHHLDKLGLAGAHLSFNPTGVFGPASDEAASMDRLEILLIHDRTEDIILAQEAFDEDGMPSNLNAVTDGAAAAAYLRREGKYAAAPRPAVILLGRNLRADGPFLAELRGNESWRDIPIVLLDDDRPTAELLAAHGLRVSLTAARPDVKHPFADVVRSVKNLCDTLVAS